MYRLVHQYVTKGGAIIDSPADKFGSIEAAAKAAGELLEMDDRTALLINTVTGGMAAVRVDQIDHIATEMVSDEAA